MVYILQGCDIERALVIYTVVYGAIALTCLYSCGSKVSTNAIDGVYVCITPPVITFWTLKKLSPGVLYSRGVIYSVLPVMYAVVYGAIALTLPLRLFV